MTEHLSLFAGIYLLFAGASGSIMMRVASDEIQQVRQEYGFATWLVGYTLACLSWPVTLALTIREFLRNP
jgi:hypothetical protein